jgi:hypothetical protein
MALHILGKDETQVQFLLRAPQLLLIWFAQLDRGRAGATAREICRGSSSGRAAD